MPRQRLIRKKNHPSQNLDSFLDILTNTVGVLMFIGLFVSLLTIEAERIITTPLRAETSKEGVFFELRNNQLFYISDPQIETQIDQLYSNLPTCNRPEAPRNNSQFAYQTYLNEVSIYNNCTTSILRRLENFSAENGQYRVSFTADGALRYEQIDNAMGEDNQQLRADDSQFSQILSNLNPNTEYVAFIVRPDSFPAFRAAREKAIDNGFQVGWEPFAQNNILVFGSGGRSVGVQ
ncbi:hypothetical protein IQ215_12230 [Cyanobacterium stanieri LEGE 03274]|uniref:Biopolymer transporter ExbD n=1 Tax=Cyanobacterium stanieri LEGE 03274 TaxID=1828756 RepID=A0ABR9V6D4_9CHRO|nr:hypothetical protein [Cyanobacterium stanieri]MBE9223465.1 hypothetical protein [Cyanobacterium stanieri LEGE 03274]